MKTIAQQIEEINFYDFLSKLKKILRGQNSTFIPDAPTDGNTYARKDAEWVEQTASSGIESITGDFVNNTDPLNPIIEDPRTYKVYTALLSQTGTNDPIPTVLENTLGQTITWSYNGTGSFITNSITGATSENLWVSITKKLDGNVLGAEEHNTGGASSVYLDQFDIISNSPINDLQKGYIEIRVYS